MIGPNFFIVDLDCMLFEVDQGHDRRMGLYAISRRSRAKISGTRAGWWSLIFLRYLKDNCLRGLSNAVGVCRHES